MIFSLPERLLCLEQDAFCRDKEGVRWVGVDLGLDLLCQLSDVVGDQVACLVAELKLELNDVHG